MREHGVDLVVKESYVDFFGFVAKFEVNGEFALEEVGKPETVLLTTGGGVYCGAYPRVFPGIVIGIDDPVLAGIYLDAEVEAVFVASSSGFAERIT